MSESPYAGLNPYSIGQAEYFFGREEESRTLGANLRSSRLTLLYGPSGVGKTSLLTAGLLYNLEKAARRNAESRKGKPGFVPVMFRNWQDDPGTAIGEGIREQVARLVPDMPTQEMNAATSLDALLESWTGTGMGDLLLVLDQFELFFVHHLYPWKHPFADSLSRCVASGTLAVNVLISVREDWLPSLDAFKGRIPGLFDNYLRLQPLSRDGATDAIRRPVEQYNQKHHATIAIEDGLVDAVLARSYRSEAEAFDAPALQVILERLWREEQRNHSDVLRLDTLQRVTRRRDIIDQYVGEALGRLSFLERRVASRLVDRLATPSGTKKAQTLRDLAENAHSSPRRVQSVIEHMAPLVNDVAPPRGVQDRCYEISHDVLAPALARWQAARQQRRKIGIAVAITGAIAVAGAAFYIDATRQKTAAIVRNLLSESERAYATPKNTELSLLLAIEAMRLSPSAAAEEKLRRAAALLPVPVARVEHADPVAGVMFAPGGKVFATRAGRVVKLVKVPSGPVKTLSHDGAVNGFTFRPDGMRIATASSDGKGRVWDVQSGKLLFTLPHEDAVNDIAYSQDGQLIATASDDRSVRLWDASSGKPVGKPMRHNACVFKVIFDGGGRLFSTGDDGGVRVWDSATQASAGRLNGEVVSSMAVQGRRPNLSYMATAGLDGVCLWQLQASSMKKFGDCAANPAATVHIGYSSLIADGLFLPWQEERPPRENGRQSTRGIVKDASVSLPHDGTILGNGLAGALSSIILTAATDGTGRVWLHQVAGAAPVAEVLRMVHRDAVTAIDSFTTADIDEDVSQLSYVTGSDDKSAMFWRYPPPFGAVTGFTTSAYSADGKRLAGWANGGIFVWDVPFEKTPQVLAWPGIPPAGLPSAVVVPGEDGPERGVAITADGRGIAAFSGRSIRFWPAGKFEKPLDATSPEPVTGLVFAGADLVIWSRARVRVWRQATAAPTDTPAFGELRRVTASPDGRFLFASVDEKLHILDRSQADANWVTPPELDKPSAWEISPDSHRLALCSDARQIEILDLGTGRVNRSDRLRSPCRNLVFDYSGERVAVGMQSDITILDAATGKVRDQVPAGGYVRAPAFSPDGKTLAYWRFSDGSIQSCDLGSKQTITVARHLFADRLLFSTDGRFLLASYGSVLVLSLSPAKLIEQACGRVTRNLSEAERQKYSLGRSWTAPCRIPDAVAGKLPGQ